jgi:hypothetical protein
MQSRNFDMSKSVKLVEGCHEFLTEYKEIGLQRDTNLPTIFKYAIKYFKFHKEIQHERPVP